MLIRDKNQHFETTYDNYSDMLYRLAFSYMENGEDAADVVQEVFIRFYDKMEQLKDDSHERAWLVRVTVNLCHDSIRRRKLRNHVPYEELGDLPDEGQPAPEVYQVIRELPEKLRLAVTLHYLEGYSVEETAYMLRITVSAVKMRLSRGRALLRKSLGEEEQDV